MSYPDGELRIYLIDEIIEENTGVYVINDEVNFEKMAYAYDVKLKIGDFVPLLLGYLSIDDLISLNKVEMCFADAICGLRKIFKVGKNYLNQTY